MENSQYGDVLNRTIPQSHFQKELINPDSNRIIIKTKTRKASKCHPQNKKMTHAHTDERTSRHFLKTSQ